MARSSSTSGLASDSRKLVLAEDAALEGFFFNVIVGVRIDIVTGRLTRDAAAWMRERHVEWVAHTKSFCSSGPRCQPSCETANQRKTKLAYESEMVARANAFG